MGYFKPTRATTPLHDACRSGVEENVKKTYEYAFLNVQDARGNTPLHLGAHSPKVTYFLLHREVDLGVCNYEGYHADEMPHAHPESVEMIRGVRAERERNYVTTVFNNMWTAYSNGTF